MSQPTIRSMPEAPLKSRYVVACGGCSHLERFPQIHSFSPCLSTLLLSTFRLLKLECLKSKTNKRDEDVVADDETAARLLPCLLRKAPPINAMTRLVPPHLYHRMICPPRRLKSNTTKSKEKTAIRKRKSLNPNKPTRKPNQPFLWKNDPDTLRWIAKW